MHYKIYMGLENQSENICNQLGLTKNLRVKELSKDQILKISRN